MPSRRPPSHPGKKTLRILCADDNAVLGDVMVRLFAAAGHRAEHVGDGLEAWDRLSPALGHFDVVITDHDMPGLNGLELVELLRQAAYRGRVVVHSATVSPRLAQKYRAFGVDAIVAKPTPGDEFVRQIEGLAV